MSSKSGAFYFVHLQKTTVCSNFVSNPPLPPNVLIHHLERMSAVVEEKPLKRALITGITGQDGSYLTELLLEKGYEVSFLGFRTVLFIPPKPNQHPRLLKGSAAGRTDKKGLGKVRSESRGSNADVSPDHS